MSSTLHWKKSWASQIRILWYLGKKMVAVYLVHSICLKLAMVYPCRRLNQGAVRMYCFFRKKENLLVDLFVWWYFALFVGSAKWWVFGLRLWHMDLTNILHMHDFYQSIWLPWPCCCQLQSFSFENCLSGLCGPYLILSILSQHSHVCVVSRLPLWSRGFRLPTRLALCGGFLWHSLSVADSKCGSVNSL